MLKCCWSVFPVCSWIHFLFFSTPPCICMWITHNLLRYSLVLIHNRWKYFFGTGGCFFFLHYQISFIDFLVMPISSVAPGNALSVWWPASLLWNISETIQWISVENLVGPFGKKKKIQAWANPVRVTLTQRGGSFCHHYHSYPHKAVGPHMLV